MVYDLLVLACVAVGAGIGVWRGLAMQVAAVLSLVLGCLLGSALTRALLRVVEAPPLLVFLGCYALIALGCYGLAALFRKRLEEKRLERWDAHMGGLVGALNGLLLASAGTFLLVAAFPGLVSRLKGHLVSPLVARTIRGVFAVLPEDVVEAAMPLVDRIREGG